MEAGKRQLNLCELVKQLHSVARNKLEEMSKTLFGQGEYELHLDHTSLLIEMNKRSEHRLVLQRLVALFGCDPDPEKSLYVYMYGTTAEVFAAKKSVLSIGYSESGMDDCYRASFDLAEQIRSNKNTVQDWPFGSSSSSAPEEHHFCVLSDSASGAVHQVVLNQANGKSVCNCDAYRELGNTVCGHIIAVADTNGSLDVVL